jgi:NTP pyrophosphatase (non-canonical NTP hydrolase)
MLEKLPDVTRGLPNQFPDGEDPFQMMTRLLEQCGELAEQVNHFEGTGLKREKHGVPDRTKLANEIHQVMRAALTVAQYYGVELELEESIETSYVNLKREGHIEE